MLIALTGIDIDTQLLPDSLTLPLLWLGLGINLFAVWTPLSSAVIGAMLGYGILWSVYWLFKWVTGKEGMGYGDFKLLGALGAWFGWEAVPVMILLSSLVGAIIGIAILLITRQGRDTRISRADIVINNSGSLDELYQRGEVLHQTLLARASEY